MALAEGKMNFGAAALEIQRPCAQAIADSEVSRSFGTMAHSVETSSQGLFQTKGRIEHEN
jgi:hypothetical protein